MPSVGTASSALTPISKTSAAPASVGQFVLADATSGAFTITLPSSPASGVVVGVKKTDSSANAVTVVSGTPVTTIDGDTSAVLLAQNAGAVFSFDGTYWRIQSTTVFNTPTSKGIVPAGGASAAVLTKNTGTDYDYSWTATSSGGGGGGMVPWTASRWVTKPGNATGMGSSTFPPAIGGVAFIPLYIPNACTINTVGFYGNTGATFRLALYTDNAASTSLGPTTMIGTQVSGSSNAALATTATVSWVVPSAGTYWLAFAYSSNTALNTWFPVASYYLGTAAGQNPVSTSGIYTCFYTTAYTYSSTLPASVASNAMTLGSAAEPVFSFRAA